MDCFKNITAITIIASLCGLPFVSSADTDSASTHPLCSPKLFEIVNHYDLSVKVTDARRAYLFPGNGVTTKTKLTPASFYTRSCAKLSITIGSNSPTFVALVPANQKVIYVRVGKDGEVSSNTPYDFKVKQLLPYTGLKPFLKSE